MGGKYSIIARNRDDKCWEYCDYYVPNVLVLFFKAVYCFAKYEIVEVVKTAGATDDDRWIHEPVEVMEAQGNDKETNY